MPGVRIETADRVMVVTLDRASKKNAITDEMYGEIAGALALRRRRRRSAA